MIPPLSSFFCPTRIFLGENAHEALGPILLEEGVKRVFAMVDSALLDTDFFHSIRRVLDGSGVSIELFSEIEPEPSAETVHKAFARQQDCRAAMIVAVGGGSTMDAAKAVAILATNGGRIADYEGIEKFKTPPLPLVAIPTTAGTGSEVSGSCVISDAAMNRKMSIRHAAWNPARYAILDPAALATAPANVVMHSGVDAFVHAFESYISKLANPFTDAINLHAMELISSNLKALTLDRRDSSAALATLCGSALAGMAFGQTGLGNIHCMARFLGAQFHLSHGLSNALCLPYVARFNMDANPLKFSRIARAMGVDTGSMSTMEAARKAVVLIQDFCDELLVPPNLKTIGVDSAALPGLARDCVGAGYDKWNPRQTTEQDFLELFKDAYTGLRLTEAA